MSPNCSLLRNTSCKSWQTATIINICICKYLTCFLKLIKHFEDIVRRCYLNKSSHKNTSILDVTKGSRYCDQLALIESFWEPDAGLIPLGTSALSFPTSVLRGRLESGPIYGMRLREDAAGQGYPARKGQSSSHCTQD